MYSISSYSRMVADNARIAPYLNALRQAVKPDSVVLDLGAGFGFFAMIACQFGARRVFAIEPDVAIVLGQELAKTNGYADRIEFFQDLSTNVTLPEKADVIISDLRGVLPAFQMAIPSIIDARTRFLNDSGILIPQRDSLWVSVISDQDLYDKQVVPWTTCTYGLNLDAALRFNSNSWKRFNVQPGQILLEGQVWSTIDYGEVQNSNLSGQVSWTVTHAGTGHGLCIWFDSTLDKDNYFSNGPDGLGLVYGSGFFPWTTPIELVVGDVVQVYLQATLVNDDYVWRWQTEIRDGNDTGSIKERFDQSTFLGVPLSPGFLRKQATTHVPNLNEAGQIESFILSAIDGKRSLETIAEDLLKKFPASLDDLNSAFTEVARVSKNYSQ